MHDPLQYLWPVAEAVTPVVAAGSMSRWPKDSREKLLSAGLLTSAGTAQFVQCPACDHGHKEQVVARELPNGESRYYVECDDLIRAEVRPDELKQYVVNVPVMIQGIASSLSLSGPSKALA